MEEKRVRPRAREMASLGEAIRAAYGQGQEDEALEPIIKVDKKGCPVGRLRQGDYAIFYDIRGEREVEISQSLIDKKFSHFPISKDLSLNFVTMIEYDPKLNVKVAFPPEVKIKSTLAEVISRAGLRLAKIAESEKAAHIGFFMNGKNEEIFPGEERFIIPSPEVTSYATHPEMSAALVTEEIVSKLMDKNFQIIIANFANVDVVGHIENKESAIKAVETVDHELGRVVESARSQRATLLVTSDHGTVEEWLYPDGQINTGHTKNPVPFILADFEEHESGSWFIREEGELSDVAPTVLDLLGLAKPVEMTGESLLLYYPSGERRREKVLILILDGWGMRDEKKGNLIAESSTPNFDTLWRNFPHARLKSSGEAVGMPSHTVGNSEAGHLHLGAGRRVMLDRVRIDRAIEDRSFFSNEAFLWAMHGAKREKKPLHLMGIVSHYSSHGTIKHLFGLLELAKEMRLKNVYVHCFVGRRGEKAESGALYVERVEEMCRKLGPGRVVTVIGRFWALDREENWARVEKAYRALVYGEGTKVCSSD